MKYEYECSVCEEVIELFRSVADRDKPAPCPHCNKPMERLIAHKTGIVLRGSGWAKDGYAKKDAVE